MVTCGMRLALAFASLLLCLGAGSVADARAASVDGPDARVLTVFGGGSRPLAEGVEAAQSDGAFIEHLAELPDGSIAFTESTKGVTTVLWRIDPRGFLRRIPSPADWRITGIAAEPEGTLLVVREKLQDVVRIDPATGRRSVAVTLPPGSRGHTPGLDKLVRLPDGSLYTRNSDLWRIDAMGSARGLRSIGGYSAAIAGTADAILASDRERVIRIAPDGTARRAALEPFQAAATLTDGSLLLAPVADSLGFANLPGGLTLLRREKTRPLTVVPRYGNGDGAAPRFATLSPMAVAPARDGGAILADEGTIRVITAGPTSRPLVAFDPRTFAGLADGQVTVVSTVAGRVEVTLRTRAGVVARASGAVEPGTTRIALPGEFARGRYELAVSLVTPDGARTAGRTAADTRPFRLVDARRTAREYASSQLGGETGESTFFDGTAKNCRRRSATRIDCRLVQVTDASGQISRDCAGSLILRRGPGEPLTLEGSPRCR